MRGFYYGGVLDRNGRYVAKGLVRPDIVITHRIDFRKVTEAFSVVEGNPKDACKVLLEFTGSA